MKVLDLCSGIGGFSLGLEMASPEFETVAFCEIEPFAQQVLKKHWPDVPIYPDIKELTHDRLQKDGIPAVDIVCAGFPCQPYSGAGEQRGTADDRDQWPEVFRLIQEIRPTWGIFENVAGFVNLGFTRTASNLESAGYGLQSFIIPACAVGAPHRRDRIWIIAHTDKGESDGTVNEATRRLVADAGSNAKRTAKRTAHGQGTGRPANEKQNNRHQFRDDAGNGSETVADTQRKRRCLRNGQREDAENVGEPSRCSQFGHWDVEPPVGRVATGIPKRVDRLKGLGNAVVPQVVAEIGKALMKAHKQAG